MNKHLIKVKYIGPTNTLGSRVKLTSYRFKESLFLRYDDSFEDHLTQAKAHLKQLGFDIIGVGESGAFDSTLITNTFKSIK